MKQIAFLLSILMLSACVAEPNKDPNALPNGIMQPVAGTGAVEGGSWMPEVKKQPMPDNMK